MKIQPVFSKTSLSAIVAGAVLALGLAHSAMAQEQVVGRAMAEPMGGMAPTASLGALGSAPLTVTTVPSLTEIPNTPQIQAQPQYQGQAAAGGQDSSPDAGSSPPTTTTTQADASPTVNVGAVPIDSPPPPPLIVPSVPPLDHKSGGLPPWLVVLLILAALWLGRRMARGRG